MTLCDGGRQLVAPPGTCDAHIHVHDTRFPLAPTAKFGPPHDDGVGALAKTVVRAAPERMRRATHWPPPTLGIVEPDDALMLDMPLDRAADETTRHEAMVDNPARLHGYPS